MKYLISLILSVIITLFTVSAFAFTPPPPPTEGYIVDSAGKLTASDLQSLNSKIEALKQATTNEIGILLLQSLDGESIEDVAQDTFKSWKVGKAGLDNGVLIVLAIKDRKIRIQTGKGVEGDLTDLQANDIIAKMKPYLRKSDFAGALGLAVDNIGTTIESRKNKKADTTPPVVDNHSETSLSLGWWIFSLPLIGGVLLAIYLWSQSKKEEERMRYLSRREEEAFNRAVSHTPVRTSTTVSTPVSSYAPVYTAPTPKKSSPSSYSSPKKSSSSYSSSSSSSSSSSWSSGGSSWGGSSDSGGGFSGGDSGGGGSSGDW